MDKILRPEQLVWIFSLSTFSGSINSDYIQDPVQKHKITIAADPQVEKLKQDLATFSAPIPLLNRLMKPFHNFPPMSPPYFAMMIPPNPRWNRDVLAQEICLVPVGVVLGAQQHTENSLTVFFFRQGICQPNVTNNNGKPTGKLEESLTSQGSRPYTMLNDGTAIFIWKRVRPSPFVPTWFSKASRAQWHIFNLWVW